MVKQRNTKDAVMSIPEMWEIKKLKDVAPLQRGFDLPYSQMKTGIYPVVFSNGIGAYHSEYMIPGPGVVTGRSVTIGKVHFVQKNYWPHNTSLWVTDFHGNHEKYMETSGIAGISNGFSELSGRGSPMRRLRQPLKTEWLPLRRRCFSISSPMH